MKAIRALALGLVLAALTGCPGMKDLIVLKEAPPYSGAVEVRMDPETSKGALLFQFDYKMDSGTTPSSSQLKEMKEKCRELGANVLILQCGAFGTVGQSHCQGRGYKE